MLALSVGGAELPAGEYCFLLACSLAGGVALAYARDLITLIVALETLTLPLYALVGLRRAAPPSAHGALTMFVVSVVAAAVTLLGAACCTPRPARSTWARWPRRSPSGWART